MTTTKLSATRLPDLQPATALWRLYRPENAPYRFQAATTAAAQAWQVQTRQALCQTIGFQNLPPTPLEPQLLESVDKGDYIRQKILLRTGEFMLMPIYLLLPKGAHGPLPTVVAFHGHGYGVKDIVGLWEDGEERNLEDGYHKDFGVALARSGFVVAAPEISCFGERQTDFSYLNDRPGTDNPGTCDHTAKLAFTLGGSVAGLRVFDARRLMDYLETRPEVDAGRIGAMGISGGGMNTFYATCLDERIRACVISGYYSTFQDSILAMHHCSCNFIPGLAQFGEMYDLVGLIAPRPMLVEAGLRDPIFPIGAVKASVARAHQVYQVFGASNQVETDFFEGRHRINGERAYDFLREKLELK